MEIDSDTVRLTANTTNHAGGLNDTIEDGSISTTTAWVCLFAAICIEVCGTSCLKLSNGYKNLVPTIFFFLFYAVSLGILPFALKKIPISISYAVWAGTGTALTSIVSVTFFKEKISWGKGLSIFGTIICLVLMNYFEGQPGTTDTTDDSTKQSK